eukprot:TRINITY_DN1022_c0_g1_i5.p1 TRINITY_DN1022_c0_g1~~TRINITY_DN1022_c0_g1_i5.p1  ORF type:complete len:1103 (-),score=421.81 TRINITY_DN1022_c0_g1_i5:126-3374(-)
MSSSEDESKPAFNPVPERFSFPEIEEQILQYWDQIDAFQTSLRQSEGRPIYNFYDGPPFATGLPHYGHILAGTIKDIVTRYWHQNGFYVSRRFGWDCHGLPVEYEIDKKLEIKSPDDVARLGIDRYNAECRSIVMRYSSEWEHIVKRMGRWIDFANDYKTMNPQFMESVWWVFKQLYEKNLVFRGFKVMPYSTACHTPLSNFEAGQNYKNVQDPAVVVSFPDVEDPNTHFLAWTTTPWTLPSNLALCVHPEFDYVKVLDVKTGLRFWLAESRLCQLYKAKKKGEPEYELVEQVKGTDLVGRRYVPLFDYFRDMEENGAFRIVSDTYVTDKDGVGIVHQAPAFGEDDYRVCSKAGIIRPGSKVPCPVNDSGCFTAQVTDFAGRYIKDADRDIIRNIKSRGRLVQDALLEHNYPHCWRSDTPLIYRAVPSWFVNVPAIKQMLLDNNEQTYWVPASIGENRFHNWLKEAREWAISRNRYWGTPLPIWISDDAEEIVVVGSVDELRELSGVQDITDLHRDKIDHITIPSRQGKGLLKRVPEVFDCWFESGSMPYAQLHYPFENKEQFEQGFPADFIAEGLDQTRGWFYTLMVISTALFNKPAFKNLIVNGLVLASDGKKMSKRLKNYPDPMNVVSTHGADALRLYLIDSPVVRAEPLKFKEEGVRDVARDVFLPWYNTYRFFVVQARRLQLKHNVSLKYEPDIWTKTDNVMDKWIISSLQSLIAFVRAEMGQYRLYTVIPELVKFVDSLSKWYVRFNKSRMKGDEGIEQCYNSLVTLFEVLYKLCILMAPFCPFLVEHMYQNLKNALPAELREDSVHYTMIPQVNEAARDADIERRIARMQEVIELGRTARSNAPFSLRIPAPEFTVVCGNPQYLQDLELLQSYIQTDMNVHQFSMSADVSNFIAFSAQPVRKTLGPRLKGAASAVCNAIQSLPHDRVSELLRTGEIKIDEHVVYKEEVEIQFNFVGDRETFESATSPSGDVLVVLNKRLTPACEQEGIAREFMSRVQKLRKNAAVSYEDAVAVYYRLDGESRNLTAALTNLRDFIYQGIRIDFSPFEQAPADVNIIMQDDTDVLGEKVVVYLVRL